MTERLHIIVKNNVEMVTDCVRSFKHNLENEKYIDLFFDEEGGDI